MKNLLWLCILAIAIVTFVSCGNEKKSHNHTEKNHDENHANHHMHKTSFDELVRRFESKERDDYQQVPKVLDYLGDIKNEKIMDIGSGTGYFAFPLAKKGAQVIAGDVDDRFLKYITDKIKSEKLESLNIETRKLPYDSPNLSKAEVDKVLIVNTYHHIEERVAYFSKVLDGLKENGQLIVIDFFKVKDDIGPPLEMRMSADYVSNELKKAGFKNIKINDKLLTKQYIIIANK